MQNPRSIIDLVAEAVALPGPEREAFLKGACADEAMLREAMSLVGSLELAPGFLRAVDAQAASLGDGAGSDVGMTIGRYRLVERLGEGGFGVVYLAEQREPVVRRVALKVIRAGMDSGEVIARFQAERQALALMDHPGIARVLDAGETEEGRPYFVMELVQGQPITRFFQAGEGCEGTVRARVGVFVEVCRAVQHAHTKGIVHRDLKPGNVLVTEVDGRAAPKVIDFGIAKALDADGRGTAGVTQQSQLVGTLEYISPEQAEGRSAEIDARADIYSLGVLLYELLAGCTPFDSQKLRSAGWSEVHRIIREDEPARPSMRGAAIPADLDWIVMKCLEKNPSRRYPTADALAADLERFLSWRPVEAAPPGTVYLIGKFARRHGVLVGAGAGVAAAMALGLAAALWQAGVAARERDAQRLAAKEALGAKAEAEGERKRTERIAEFQAAQLRGIDVEKMGRGIRDQLLENVRARLVGTGASEAAIGEAQRRLGEALDQSNLTSVALNTLDANIFERTLAAINEQFADEPLIRASLLQTSANTMAELGLVDAAATPQREAVEIRRRELGSTHPETVLSINQMGELAATRGDWKSAEELFREAYKAFADGGGAGPDSREALAALGSLAVTVQMLGRMEEAEPLRREALDRAVRSLGPDDPDTLQHMNNTAGLLHEQGKTAEAEPLFRETLERRKRVLGPDHLETLQSMNNLATVLEARRAFGEAEPLYREALERSRSLRGENHPDTLLYLGNVGHILFLQKRLAEAEPFARETLERRRKVLHDDHWETQQAMHNMAMLLMAKGEMSAAEPLFREALEWRRKTLGEDHPAAVQSVIGLSDLLGQTGRFGEAEQMLVAAERAMSAGGPAERRDACRRALVGLYGRWARAEPGKGHESRGEAWREKLGKGEGAGTLEKD